MSHEPKPRHFLYRHPLLAGATLILVTAALWVGYFLTTFDLDHYREQIVETLSARLGMEVRLGEAHLELREGGIAFRFADVQVGTPQNQVELRARKLWLQLAWHGLLLRKPVLTEVALEAPHLRIAPSSAPTDGTPPSDEPFNLETLNDLQISRFEIHQGELVLSRQNADGSTPPLSLTELEIEIGQLGLGRTVTFNGTGSLSGQTTPARLAVNGSISLPAGGSLPTIDCDLAMEVKGLDAGRVSSLFAGKAGMRATGSADLQLFLKGSPSREMTVQAEVAGTGLSIMTGPAAGGSFPVKHLLAAGIWQRGENRHEFRQVALQLNDLRLTGEFSLVTGTDGHQITGRLGNSTLPLDSLRHWAPPALLASNPVLSHRLPGGLITLEHAGFHAEIPFAANGFGSFSLDELHGEAKGLNWELGGGKRAELKAMGFRLEDNRWHFERGTGSIAGMAVALNGTVGPHDQGPAEVAANLTVNGTTEQLLALAATPLPAGLALAGDFTVTTRLTGTWDEYFFVTEADLSHLDLSYGEELRRPPTPGSGLKVSGHGTPVGLTIDQSTLQLAPLTGALSGRADWSDTGTVNLTAQAELVDLTAAYDLVPALRSLELRGGLRLNLELAGPLDTPATQASFDLRDISIPTHGIVADITGLNGRLLPEGKGIRSVGLTGRLGKSPVILQARVADLASPRLELDLKAPAVRADEVIFHSDRTMLRDLDGRLIFDRDSLQFAPVKVRLDKGTRATVTGSIRDFSAPRVDLAITGDYANVEEIIGLWTDESPAAEKSRLERRAAAPHGPLPPIRIEVEAREGDLYGMKFNRARTLIVPTSERLLLHPLDFYVGEGYCTTQVLVDYSGDHTLLRTSGHIENVDAYQVVNELLDRKSIMRGNLRGDFYLQGELGEGRFYPTSFGNVNVTVHDGVMRHSPILSTVFSLLNVSQLFSFKLPDVNSEGVPFTRLSAELAIDKGILSSDPVTIDSEAMAMSYVGKYDLAKDDLDLLVVVKPLGTIDKVVTSLPIAGWILGGNEKALITAQFKVTGKGSEPDVEAIPISAISRGVLGLLQRSLSLPLKLIEDPAILWGGGGKKN